MPPVSWHHKITITRSARTLSNGTGITPSRTIQGSNRYQETFTGHVHYARPRAEITLLFACAGARIPSRTHPPGNPFPLNAGWESRSRAVEIGISTERASRLSPDAPIIKREEMKNRDPPDTQADPCAGARIPSRTHPPRNPFPLNAGWEFVLVRESLLASILRGILSPLTRDGNPDPGRASRLSPDAPIIKREEMKNRDPPDTQADPGHKGGWIICAVSGEQRSDLACNLKPARHCCDNGVTAVWHPATAGKLRLAGARRPGGADFTGF